MKIWFLASEIVPFAKSGGLADVAGSLGRYLGQAGHDVRLCMPLYGSVRAAGHDLRPHPRLEDMPCRLGWREVRFSVLTGRLPESDVEVYFLDAPELFERDGLYGEAPDEHLRFAFLARASLMVCQWLAWAPDVVHCNDWHTALAPLYLRAHFGWDRLFESTRTLLTIHNIAFQGVFGAGAIEELGLGDFRHALHAADVERDTLNFLRTGILHADLLSTVSPTYAREIQTAEQGMGLEQELAARGADLHGILNGVDYGEWDPRRDARIAATYGPEDLSGKATCRRALLEAARLAPDPVGPVLGVVTRLSWQKGIELLLAALPPLLEREDARLVVLGSGDSAYEAALRELAERLPTRVSFRPGYDEDLAHRIEAGSDLFLMPSRYEPCGLNQMYSLRYGTVPLVRRTGGLADSVEPYRAGPDAAADRGTGFLFRELEPASLTAAAEEAFALYRDPERWRALMLRGMARDFSWETEGARYEQLDRSLRG
jgi:starch synthase